jgi:hypothetical protein
MRAAALRVVCCGVIAASMVSMGQAQDKGERIMTIISGSFDVKTTPQPAAPGEDRSGRMVLEKTYHGALNAHAVGLMLTGGDLKTATAGYVAIETVNGQLDGKTGSFQLMHWATMRGKDMQMRIEVVPGSGSGELKGIEGTLKIAVAADGKHNYEFQYSLPAA